MSRNFFEEFAKNDFFEKKASENENIKSTLGSITPSILEKLAEEIGALSDEEDMTLEQKLASEEEKEDPKEEEKEDPKEDKEAEAEPEDKKEDESKEEEPKEDKEAEGCSDKEDDEKEAEAESEDKKEEPKEDKEAAGCSDKEEEKEAEPEDETASKEEEKKEEPKEDKEAAGCSNKEDEVKQAYELAEQKLASAGLTVADYVYEKTASESTALFVSENAEKLASLSDKTTLQVADEILSAMAEKLG